MFNLDQLPGGSTKKQKEAVADVVQKAILDGVFTYTELLAAAEPMRTFALEFLDGVTVQGSIPTTGAAPVTDWDNRPFRLAHVNPEGRIRFPVIQSIRVVGTSRTRPQKVQKDFGNIADVHDTYPTRIARMILVQKGWPLRQELSRGGIMGEVVEVEWLKKEVENGSPADGVEELWEELSARIAKFDAAPVPSAGPMKATTKSKDKAPLGAGAQP